MRLGIFCSSKPVLAPLFRDSIRSLLLLLEASGYFTSFSYGGGSSGLMGFVREYATLPVVGHNLPRWDPLPDEKVYHSLRERQGALIDDADAYLVLPGGVGTMHELFQVLCENDVEKKERPILIYDPDLVYAPLEELLSRMHQSGYLASPARIHFFRSEKELSTSLGQIFSR
mgnify:CR=1 FL=1